MNCNNTLFIPKHHAHKESDFPGALSSLPIDILDLHSVYSENPGFVSNIEEYVSTIEKHDY